MTAQSKITQQLDRISQLFHSKKPYFLPMTETPEWFQIPDSPEPEPQRPRRITLKVALMTAPLLLIGGAVVFAENGNEGDDQPNLPKLTTTNTNTSTGIDWITLSSDLTGDSLEVKGNANFHGDLKLQGKSLKDSLDRIEERLAILRPNEELEEKWEQLRGLRKMYMELEAEIIEKEKVWSILKK